MTEEVVHHQSICNLKQINNPDFYSSHAFIENKGLNEQEIAEKKIILKSKPLSLGIVLTTRCNIECIMCPDSKQKWEISRESIEDIISYFPYLQNIFLRGGEAFLSDYFYELIKITSKFPMMNYTMDTNGLFINDAWLKILAGKNLGIVVSVHGVTKKTYEYISRGAEFEDLIEKLDLLSSFKKDGIKDNAEIKTCMNFVVMKSNYHEMEKALDFALEYNFDSLRWLPILDNTGPLEEQIFQLPKSKEWHCVEKKIPELAVKAGNNGIVLQNWLPKIEFMDDVKLTKLRNNCSPPFGVLCHVPWQHLYIDVMGKVKPACFCENVIGDINKSPIDEIWNNDKMQNFRRKILNNNFNGLCNKLWIASPGLRKCQNLAW